MSVTSRWASIAAFRVAGAHLVALEHGVALVAHASAGIEPCLRGGTLRGVAEVVERPLAAFSAQGLIGAHAVENLDDLAGLLLGE